MSEFGLTECSLKLRSIMGVSADHFRLMPLDDLNAKMKLLQSPFFKTPLESSANEAGSNINEVID